MLFRHERRLSGTGHARQRNYCYPIDYKGISKEGYNWHVLLRCLSQMLILLRVAGYYRSLHYHRNHDQQLYQNRLA